MAKKNGKGAMRLCANGDGRPVCPPSKVLCRECMDGIGDKLRGLIAKMDANAAEREGKR